MSRRQKEGLDGWATKNCASLQNAMYYLTDKMEGILKAGKRVLTENSVLKFNSVLYKTK